MLAIQDRILHGAVPVALALFMNPVFAHSGAAHAGTSFSAGFTHPFSGLDHLLVMLAVGLWAAQQRRSGRWILLPAFPVMMVGALAGVAGLQFPGAESGIAATLVAAGLLVAFALRFPGWIVVVTISLFAGLHGYAHGNELPAGASFALYGAGFITASALLLWVGLAAGSMSGQKLAARAVRVAGAGIALAGVWLMAAAA